MKNYLEEKRTNIEVGSYVLQNGFLPRHANEILRKLQQEGEISVAFSDGSNRKVRRNAFYLEEKQNKIQIQKKYRKRR